VLHEAPTVATAVHGDGPHFLVLSARGDDALRASTSQWRAALGALDAADLADACRVSRIGRSALPERLAVWGADAVALQVALTAFLDGDTTAAWVRGSVAPSGAVADPVATPMSESDPLVKIARDWTSGVTVDWSTLDPQRARRGLDLPLYPFRST
jgi:acyl transferase domain-containing protein